jgi:hypothetical protein
MRLRLILNAQTLNSRKGFPLHRERSHFTEWGSFYHDLLRDPIKLKNRGAGQSFEKCMSNDKPSGWGRGQTAHTGKVFRPSLPNILFQIII